MITPKDMEKFSNNEVVIMYQKLNERLSKTIIQKLKQNGDISSFTKAQIRTLQLQGGKDIFKQALKETNGLTKQRKEEISNLFDEIAEKEISGYSEVYRQKDLDYELSKESAQLLKKVKQITNNEMKNFTRSVAYASQNTYINAVDDLYKQVISGAYDYDSAMKKTITELAEKGVTLKTKDGRNEKLEVAVRRNLMTSIKQTANSIAKDVGDIIGANCVVIGHSTRCRPTHYPIDAVTMSIKKFQALEYLTEEPNCYHLVNYDWQPEFEGTTNKVIYDDEHLSYADTVKNYNIQQKARYYERQIRNKKMEIASGNDTDKTREQLRNAQARLRIYNKANGLEQDYARTWVAGYNGKARISTNNNIKIQNIKDVEKRIKNIVGANEVNLNKMDINLAKEYLDGIETFYKDYPQLKGFIEKVGTKTKPRAGAQFELEYDANTQKSTQRIQLRNPKNIEKYKNEIKENIKTGYWYENTNIKSIAIHECTHALDYAITQKRKDKYGKKITVSEFRDLMGSNAGEIIKEARMSLYNEEYGRKSYEASKVLGEYSHSNYTEQLAQAISYNYVNKGTEYTKKVQEIFNRYYKETFKK